MLIRLLYVSTAHKNVGLDEFRAILAQAQTNNEARDLTGVLAFNSKMFLQALEGARDQVNTLYGKLLRDPRHHSVTLLSLQDIERRQWADWSMGFVAPNSANRALLLRYSESSTFDPYKMPAETALQMLQELAAATVGVAAATATERPVAADEEQGFFSRFIKKPEAALR
jgi:hypothetical protein